METSIITSKPAASTSTSTTKTYDDGQWHTSYPPWSNGTATTTQPSLPSMTASSSTAAGDRLATRVSGLFTRAVMVGERVLKALVFFRNWAFGMNKRAFMRDRDKEIVDEPWTKEWYTYESNMNQDGNANILMKIGTVFFRV
jgi:hypothetical protein